MTHETRSDLDANVWKVLVAEGQHVAEGDTLMILESMKMEIPVSAPVTGTVHNLAVAAGDIVDEDQLLAAIE